MDWRLAACLYSRLEVARDGVQLRYVLDLAEVPTLQELGRAGGTAGAWDTAVRERMLAAKARELPAGARLEIDGRPVAWTVPAATLDLLPGQADLETLRIELTLAADAAVREGARLAYQDANYPGRAGWHEVVLRATEGLDLLGSTAPTEDASDELRAYPADPARAPLAQRAADLPLARAIPVLSARAISAAGLAITIQALSPFSFSCADCSIHAVGCTPSPVLSSARTPHASGSLSAPP